MGFLDKKEIKKLETTAEEKGTPKSEPAPGIYTATLKSIKVETAKSSGDLMIVIEEDIGVEYFPPKLFCVFGKKEKAMEMGKEKVIGFFKRAFHYSFTPITTDDLEDALAELVNQVKQFVGKKYKLAIRHEQELYAKTVDGEKQVVEQMRAKHWFVGHIDEPLDFNEKSAVRYLTPQQKSEQIKKIKSKQSFIKEEAGEPEAEAEWVKDDKDANPFG